MNTFGFLSLTMLHPRARIPWVLIMGSNQDQTQQAVDYTRSRS